MSAERAGKRLGRDAKLSFADVGRALDGWLDELEQSENGLLRAYGRARLREMARRWLTAARPEAALHELAGRCSPADLKEAARALRRQVSKASRTGRGKSVARDAVLALARRMARAAASTGGGSAGPALGDSAEELRRASAAVHRAKTPRGVMRAAASGALRICAAKGAVWWERSDQDDLQAAAARGVRLAGKRRRFRVKRGFWGDAARGKSRVALLSGRRADHADFLAHVEAGCAVVIPVNEGGRWIGALSVHDGVFDRGRRDLLVTLTEQTQSALRALELEGEGGQLTREQSESLSEVGSALSSALSLSELLGIICGLALRGTRTDSALLFLADDDGGLRLRGRADRDGRARELDLEAIIGVAGETRAQPVGQVLWRTGPELARGRWRAIGKAGFGSVIEIPLAVRGEWLGALLLLSMRPLARTPAQCQALLSLGGQAAVAIQNLQLMASTQRRLLEMADLNWVSARITASLDAGQVAATVADAASKALDAPRVALFVEGETGECRPIRRGQLGLPEEKEEALPAGGHVGAEALVSGTPQSVDDVQSEGRAEDCLVQWLGARSLVCAPMVARQGMRGLFVVADTRPRVFRSHAVALVSAYANQTALALQSALLYQDVVSSLTKLSKLFEVSQSLASSLELKEILETVLDSAGELLDAPVSSVMLLDREADELVMKATRGLQPDHALYDRLKPGEGMAGRAAQSGLALTSADITRDGRFKHRQRAREEGLRAGIAAPLIARGRTVGVLNLYRKTSEEFDDEDRRLLTAFTNSAAVAIENAHLYEEAQERAQFLAAMMGEINHRMRNTLQVVADLLRMELQRPTGRSLEEALNRGIARIQTVAVVHELMGARELQFVDLKQVARRIVQLTCRAAGRERDIGIKVSGARVAVASQKATTVALIFSELIDNALRHGLATTAQGEISISLADAGGDVVIQVTDSGVGLPEGFDVETKRGLGLEIVRGLVEEDLEGKLEFETNGGLTVRARFAKR